MSIEEQLRLLSEGNVALNDDEDDVELDKELVESWFINSNKFLSESVNSSSLSDLLIEMTTLVEAGTATPDETLGFLTKLKLKLKQFGNKMDAFEGLKELEIIRTRMEILKDYRQVGIWFGPYIGVVIYIMKASKRYSGMDENTIKKYINEAERFRGILYNQIKNAEKNNDEAAVKKLTRISKKLDNQIKIFKDEATRFGKHKI